MTSMLLRRFTANSCTASILQPPAENYARVAFDVAVALVCMLSLLLCGRSILRGIMLQQVRKALSNQHCRHDFVPTPIISQSGEKVREKLACVYCLQVNVESKNVPLHVFANSSLTAAVCLLGVCALLQGDSGP